MRYNVFSVPVLYVVALRKSYYGKRLVSLYWLEILGVYIRVGVIIKDNCLNLHISISRDHLGLNFEERYCLLSDGRCEFLLGSLDKVINPAQRQLDSVVRLLEDPQIVRVSPYNREMILTGEMELVDTYINEEIAEYKAFRERGCHPTITIH